MIRIEHLEDGPKDARLLKVAVGRKELVTPTYFPAVSKKEIGDADDRFVELITASRYPRLLISAYDYGKMMRGIQRQIIGKLSDYYRAGSIIMLDSGVFESYWREDHRWNFRNYRESVKNIDSDFFLSFDILCQESMNTIQFRKKTMKSILDSAKLANGSHCIPIIHGRKPSLLVALVSDLVQKAPQQFLSLAVSERELGNSISERCTTVTGLRKILNKRGGGLLHVLGCGNPVSMALYVYCGADMFDSLDWAVSAFDPVEERLVDVSHFELLGCNCEACSNSRIEPTSKVYLHNLLSYQNFSMKLQYMIRQGTLKDYLLEVAGKALLKKLT